MYDIDWSKSHNGLMLCSFEQAYELMPEVTPILKELIPILELPITDYLVDVKIHMLMPNQFPCIPNWHRDFMPRDAKGNRILADASPLKMYMWLSGPPLTEYKDINGISYFKQPQQWHIFTQNDLHRGTVSDTHRWRCFIRVIPKQFVHSHTINTGTIRRHTQVYLDSKHFHW